MLLRACLLLGTTLSLWAEQSLVRPEPGMPFSAVAITSSGDNKTSAVLARDSKGRTREEVKGRVTICDPVAQTKSLLYPAEQRADVYTLGGVETPFDSFPRPESEDLGVSVMEGLAVHGYRKQETDFSQEGWYSDQLHMVVKGKTTSPQGMTTTLTLTQVTLNEPDPTLFQVPPEYSVGDARGAIRVDGGTAEANLIKKVPATYPALAKSARVQGSVEFAATIGTDGLIKNLQLVRGHPLLVNAAKEAVLQWRYRPTLLNGKPTAVIAPVIVNFTLRQ